MPQVTVRHLKDEKRYEHGFEIDGAWVPLGSTPESTVKNHVQRVTDTDRRQFPQKDE